MSLLFWWGPYSNHPLGIGGYECTPHSPKPITIMAHASFHSFRGSKSALILVRKNAFTFQASPVYVPKAAVIAVLGESPEKGDVLEIPDGFTLVPMVDEDGNERTTNPNEDGEVFTLMTLQY